jgi:hypothetical protein
MNSDVEWDYCIELKATDVDVLTNCEKAEYGDVEVQLPPFSASAPGGANSHIHTPVALLPGKVPQLPLYRNPREAQIRYGSPREGYNILPLSRVKSVL